MLNKKQIEIKRKTDKQVTRQQTKKDNATLYVDFYLRLSSTDESYHSLNNKRTHMRLHTLKLLVMDEGHNLYNSIKKTVQLYKLIYLVHYII